MSKEVIQSYIYTQKINYFVSTIYRRSSAMLNPDGWYYETFAWTLKENGEKDEWVEDNSGAISLNGALKQHYGVCDKLSTSQESERKGER